jgi:hypothetical protein
VRVKVSDRVGLSTEQVFAISVLNVNEAPIDLGLSRMALIENNSANLLVGIFSAMDWDKDSTFTYALVAGGGDSDNEAFTIQGNELCLKNHADFETKVNYSIRVRVTDPYGLSREEILSVAILNQEELPLFINLL